MGISEFDSVRVFGEMTLGEQVDLLREIGDQEAASELAAIVANNDNPYTRSTSGVDFAHQYAGDRKPPLYSSARHTVGYVPRRQAGSGLVSVTYAGAIDPDPSLKGKLIRVSLDRLRVADYPGSGQHRILVDYSANHQIAGGGEKVHFSQTFDVGEDEEAGVIGYPVFLGLAVGNVGVAFDLLTINVENKSDRAMLDFMNGSVFKDGLKLITSANPALAPLTGFATGILGAFLKRNENVPVQKLYLGLDFEPAGGTGAALATGSYIAVQLPPVKDFEWHWDDWVYDPDNGNFGPRKNPSEAIPFNYMVFRITEYAE